MDVHAEPVKPPQSEQLLILILSLIQFSHVVDFVIMMPLGPQFMRVFELSPTEFGFVVSSYTFSAAVSGVIGAWFIDRLDRRIALIALYLGFTIATFVCAIAPTHHYFILGRVLSGAFGGVLGAMVFSVIGDMIPEKRRGAATGKVMSAFALASILGVPLGLAASNTLTWRAPFFFLTFLSGLVCLFAVVALPSMRRHLRKFHQSTNSLSHFWFLLTDTNHLRAYLLTASLMLAAFSVIPYLSPFYVANTGFLEKDLGYIYFIGGAFTFLTSPYIGRLSDEHGKFRIFAMVALLSTFPIIFITHLSTASSLLIATANTFFMILISGRMVPAVAMITSSVLPEHRGGFMSINSSIQQLSMGISASLAGLIIAQTAEGKIQNYNIVGMIAAVTTVLCVFIARKLRPAKSTLSKIDEGVRISSSI